MAQHPTDNIPLGEILTKARFDKRMTRAEVAREAGISENSLVRYEKAGIEKDGQFPPSPKLAKLCFVLDIPPLKALLGCLDDDDYDDYRGRTWEEWLMGHPDYEYLTNQWFAVVRENFKLTQALKTLLSPPVEDGTWKREYAERTVEEGVRAMTLNEQFYDRLVEQKLHPKGMPLSFFSVAGSRDRDLYNYAEFIENGPGNKILDRSQSDQTNPEAVGAASPTDTKEGDDR